MTSGPPDEPLPDELVSERLRLPLVTPEDAAGMLSGRRRVSWHPDYPSRADQDAVAMVRPGSVDACWGPRHVVRSLDGLVVGSVGFFAAPEPGPDDVLEAEVGVRLVEDASGHRVAEEALRALLAETDRVGVRVRASVRPEDGAGVSTLAACGFTRLRGSNEDGELVMVRPL